MLTYMRSESAPSRKGSSSAPGKPAPRGGATPEDQIPVSPPAPLRNEYFKVSWAYIYWCSGMLAWTLLCVVYFVMTRQTTDMIIGIALGVLLVAMIVLPAMLFGGATWYKRLGWMMLLLALFSAMWIYPIIVIGYGVRRRIGEGRYHHPSTQDLWHAALSGLTLIVSAWTIILTLRIARLVRQLYRGEFGVTGIRVKTDLHKS